MKGLARTRAVGGSLIVTIPIEIVKEKSLTENELIEIEVKRPKKDGFGILKGKNLPSFSREDELDVEI